MFRATVPAQRLCLALLLAIGSALPWAIMANMVFIMVLVMPHLMWEVLNDDDSVEQETPGVQQVVVTTDGEIMVQKRFFDGPDLSYDYRSPDGRPLTGPAGRSRILSVDLLSSDPGEDYVFGMGSRVVYAADVGAERWYLVVHRDNLDGLCYFAGYDPLSRMPVGFLGADGFQNERPIEEEMLLVSGSPISSLGRIPGMAVVGSQNTRSAGLFLLSDGRLLKVDPTGRSVAPVLERSDLIDIAEVIDPSVWSPATERAGSTATVVGFPILLRTAESILQFDPLAETVEEIPLPEQLREREFQFYPRGEEPAAVVLWSGSGDRSDWGTTKYDVVLLDRQGAVTGRFDGVALSDTAEQSATPVLLHLAFHAPAPLASLTLATLLVPMDSYGGTSYTPADVLGVAWPAILLTCVVGGICTFLTVRRQRTYRQPHSVTWGMFVFALGLLGYVGYLLHRKWPDVEPPQPPEPNGLEILAGIRGA